MQVNISANPTPELAFATTEAVALNNQAFKLQNDGDLEGAERLYLRSLEVKQRGMGPRHTSTALSYNTLGELYMKMGRLDEADDYLRRAIDIRRSAGPPFDLAVSRENLAQLYEMRGNLQEAKATRLSGDPNLSCSNYKCPGQLFNLSQLSQCGRCKAAYYCSKSCQKQDWKERHKQYCKAD